MVGSKHWWTLPNFGKVKKSVTDVSAMSPDMLVLAFQLYRTVNSVQSDEKRLIAVDVHE